MRSGHERTQQETRATTTNGYELLCGGVRIVQRQQGCARARILFSSLVPNKTCQTAVRRASPGGAASAHRWPPRCTCFEDLSGCGRPALDIRVALVEDDDDDDGEIRGNKTRTGALAADDWRAVAGGRQRLAGRAQRPRAAAGPHETSERANRRRGRARGQKGRREALGASRQAAKQKE